MIEAIVANAHHDVISNSSAGFAARKIWEQMNENVEAAYAGAISLPLWPGMPSEAPERVVTAFAKALA
jgi:dTDP-4-amino-4,6-dideoxygalactose transaminase